MRPAKAIVNLEAIKHNYQVACNAAPQAQAIAVVKANAYGHGAIEVARALDSIAPAFAVACIEEALELREAGINSPILLLEGVFGKGELELAAESGFWVVVENQMQLDLLVNTKLEKPVRVWVGIDSGMHRLGIDPSELDQYLSALEASDNVTSDVVLATHFASADEPDSPFTQLQTTNFEAITKGYSNPTSMANSAAIMAWPNTHATWIRPGYMLYGNSPLAVANEYSEQLIPAMTLKSAVISVREIKDGETVGYAQSFQAAKPTKIATVAIGYGDGYPRIAKNGTPVLINGIEAPLAGRVSMDMITVDVSNIDDVKIGDEVILWGEQLSVNRVAECAGTIGYELLTRMPSRVPHIYR